MNIDLGSLEMTIRITATTESQPANKISITDDHIVNLIMEGYTWSDIIRAHPGLVEDDIRACLQRTLCREA